MTIRTDDNSPAAATLTPAESGGRAEAVATELDGIFAEIGGLPQSNPDDPAAGSSLDSLGAFSIGATAPERRRLASVLGPVVVVLLFGAAVGLLVARQHTGKPAPSTAPQTLSIALSSTPPVLAQPQSGPAAATIAPATAQALPASPTPVPALSPDTAPRPARLLSAVTAAPTPAASTATQQLEPTDPSPAGRAAQPQLCANLPPAVRARCAFPAVKEADSELRDAYDAAANAGVPRPILVRYRIQWDTLRGRAAYDPFAAINGFESMAADLNGFAMQASDGN